MMIRVHRVMVILLALPALAMLIATGARDAGAGGGPPPLPELEPPFDQSYIVTDLGQVEDLPPNYGGVTLLAQSEHLLVGGNANEEDGALYTVFVTRDGDGHITSFDGPAEQYARAPFIDGGLAYGPDGVLFYARYNPPMVEIGQFVTGSPAPTGCCVPPGSGELVATVFDLAPLGVQESPGGLNFVPPGYPGAGRLKLTSYDDGDWYDIELPPDADGPYVPVSATRTADLPDGMESFDFVPHGSPGFGPESYVVINEYSDSSIAAYELDENGDPIPDRRRLFLTGIDGPDGAAFDPLSGDLIVSDYGDDRLYRISGFAAPPPYLKGDNDCDTDVDAVDALAGVRFAAELGASQGAGCYELGAPLVVPSASPAGYGVIVFGDVDCDEDVDAVDSLFILRFVAALPTNLPQACPPIGAASATP